MSERLPGALGIVVVNYASHELLERNLTRVAAGMPNAIIVVVDNYSTVSERERVLDLAEEHGWLVVQPTTNLGFGAGMNVGAAQVLAAGATQMLLINPDASIDPQSIGIMGARVDAEPMTLVAPVVLDPSGGIWSSGTDLYLRTGRTRSARRRDVASSEPLQFWLSGACLMISAQLWTALGGFDEDYFLYWEDVDLSVRAVECGATLAVEEAARATHDEGGTQARASSVSKSSTYYYFNTRNRMVFAAKHLDGPGFRRWSRTSFSAAYEILLRGGRRQFLHPVPPVSAALRGTIAGHRFARRLRIREVTL